MRNVQKPQPGKSEEKRSCQSPMTDGISLSRRAIDRELGSNDPNRRENAICRLLDSKNPEDIADGLKLIDGDDARLARTVESLNRTHPDNAIRALGMIRDVSLIIRFCRCDPYKNYDAKVMDTAFEMVKHDDESLKALWNYEGYSDRIRIVIEERIATVTNRELLKAAVIHSKLAEVRRVAVEKLAATTYADYTLSQLFQTPYQDTRKLILEKLVEKIETCGSEALELVAIEHDDPDTSMRAWIALQKLTDESVRYEESGRLPRGHERERQVAAYVNIACNARYSIAVEAVALPIDHFRVLNNAKDPRIQAHAIMNSSDKWLGACLNSGNEVLNLLAAFRIMKIADQISQSMLKDVIVKLKSRYGISDEVDVGCIVDALRIVTDGEQITLREHTFGRLIFQLAPERVVEIRKAALKKLPNELDECIVIFNELKFEDAKDISNKPVRELVEATILKLIHESLDEDILTRIFVMHREYEVGLAALKRLTELLNDLEKPETLKLIIRQTDLVGMDLIERAKQRFTTLSQQIIAEQI